MGIILFLIATIMLWILSPLFIIYSLIKTPNLSNYFRDTALSIDQLGNTMGGPIMNNVLIKSESLFKFGNPDQTISYVLGKNQELKTLTRMGLFIVKILNKIEKNHVEKAVEYEQ